MRQGGERVGRKGLRGMEGSEYRRSVEVRNVGISDYLGIQG